MKLNLEVLPYVWRYIPTLIVVLIMLRRLASEAQHRQKLKIVSL